MEGIYIVERESKEDFGGGDIYLMEGGWAWVGIVDKIGSYGPSGRKELCLCLLEKTGMH